MTEESVTAESSAVPLEEQISQQSAFVRRIRSELESVVVGQRKMVDRLMVGLLTGGHVLLEGVPGLAKTLTVKSLAQCLNMDFQRIQFTPDLLPADLIGTMIYDPSSREFEPRKGPVFANILLADEINRAPAKVQSALLEAMQEKQVTLGDVTWPLPRPFLVLATQNPIEQEGTYSLPEAQVDRFMLMLKVTYPTREEERVIMDRMTDLAQPPTPQPCVSVEEVLAAQSLIRRVQIDTKLRDYIVNLIHATRDPGEYGLSSLRDYIEYGASPRATISLNLAARAQAFMEQRFAVMPEDIKLMARDVLRHRVILTFEAEAEEITTEDVLDQLLENVPVP